MTRARTRTRAWTDGAAPDTARSGAAATDGSEEKFQKRGTDGDRVYNSDVFYNTDFE